jgi:integrase
MPAKPEGVYSDKRGQWYFKVSLGKDPLTGMRTQLTRRGFHTATEAAKARHQVLAKFDTGQLRPSSGALTVDDLLDLYLDGIDADEKLSAKTRYDYRDKAADYVRPLLGKKRVRDLTPDVMIAWQRSLLNVAGGRLGKPLAPNTVRLARAPLAGALKMALSMGIIGANPLLVVPRPTPKRSIPRHWWPEQAQEFLALMEGDRTYAIWAFLMGSGLRIGELVALRWPNVDLDDGIVRVVEFSSYLGHDVVSSPGKSNDAVRSVDLDPGLIRVLKLQRTVQTKDQLAAHSYERSDHVFTKPSGGPYHPQYFSRLLSRTTAELNLPRLSAHGLRHTCATLMLANGVPPKVAAERLGHSDPTLFMNLYSHVTPTMQRDAANKIGEALFGSS